MLTRVLINYRSSSLRRDTKAKRHQTDVAERIIGPNLCIMTDVVYPKER